MFDPGGNLEVAMQIYRNRGMCSKAGIRAAVSRCYYSSLLAVMPHLEPGPRARGDDLHRIAIAFVTGADARMGDRLKCLYDYRLEADIGGDGNVEWTRDLITELRGMAIMVNDYVRSSIGP